MAEEEQKPERKDESNRVQMTSTDIVKLVIYFPVICVWLFMAARIILSASTSQYVLDNIEPLIAVLSILTIPCVGIIQDLGRSGKGKGKED
jgi:hypothetical protein